MVARGVLCFVFLSLWSRGGSIFCPNRDSALILDALRELEGPNRHLLSAQGSGMVESFNDLQRARTRASLLSVLVCHYCKFFQFVEGLLARLVVKSDRQSPFEFFNSFGVRLILAEIPPHRPEWTGVTWEREPAIL